MRWLEQKPKLLIIIVCLIGIYSNLQFRSKNYRSRFIKRNRNCRNLKNNWILQNEDDIEVDKQVVSLPTEILMTNSSNRVYSDFNDIALRKYMLVKWSFKRLFPKNTRYIYVDKIRGNGEIKLDGKVIGHFLNEFKSLELKLPYRLKRSSFMQYG